MGSSSIAASRLFLRSMSARVLRRPAAPVLPDGHGGAAVIEEEEEDWYMDDDEEGMQPHAGDISEEEDIPGDDEFTYALAGLTV